MSKIDGLDLVDWKPDCSRTLEENREEHRRRHFEVYGEYPPQPAKE